MSLFKNPIYRRKKKITSEIICNFVCESNVPYSCISILCVGKLRRFAIYTVVKYLAISVSC